MDKKKIKQGAQMFKEASAVKISAPAAKLNSSVPSIVKKISGLKSQLTKWQRGGNVAKK